MSEKDIERQRKIITDIIQNQLKIIKLNGKSDQKITLSLPKVPYVNKTEVLKILEELLGYKPELTVYQEVTVTKPSIMLITLKLNL